MINFDYANEHPIKKCYYDMVMYRTDLKANNEYCIFNYFMGVIYSFSMGHHLDNTVTFLSIGKVTKVRPFLLHLYPFCDITTVFDSLKSLRYIVCCINDQIQVIE